MSIKFRKRVRVIPGVTLNLSFSTLSATIGVKGFNVNIGEKGTYLNTGIPGSGLYDRKRIDRNTQEKTLGESIKATENEIKSNEIETLTNGSMLEVKKIIIESSEEKRRVYSSWQKVESSMHIAQMFLFLSYILLIGFFTKKNKRKLFR